MFDSIESAIEDIKAGKIVIVVDDEDGLLDLLQQIHHTLNCMPFGVFSTLFRRIDREK